MSTQSSSENPKISVIIPTYNRPKALQAILQSLLKQTLPFELWEVIVVDDGSIMELEIREIAHTYKVDLPLIYFRMWSNQGPAKARNQGVVLAKGKFVVFIDDDCIPQNNWLQLLLNILQKHPSALIGGHTINILTNNLYAKASQLLIDYLYQYFLTTPMMFFTSNNFALSKTLFLDAGSFDITFKEAAGEDREFCVRWQFQGRKLQYHPEIEIQHAHHLNLKKYWKQHFRYGKAAYFFRARIKHQQKETVKIEPLPFYMQLLYFPFQKREQHFIQKTALSLLLLLSQLSNLTGFFVQKWLEKNENTSQ